MKLSLTFTAILAAALQFAGNVRGDERALIIQSDLDTGTTRFSIHSETRGTETSLLPISGTGSEFVLWAEGTGNDDEWYLLDQEVVGAYQPQAEVTLTSDDPYPTLRTRADQPFGYRIRVWGLSSDPEAQAAARSVNFSHQGQNYNPVTYSGAGNEVYDIATYDLQNTDTTESLYSQLVGFADPTKKVGEERFMVTSYPDDEVPSYSILANERIQIWPVADATFTGITSGQVIESELPTIVVSYQDSYPSSTTYVQVYAGEPAFGTEGDAVPGSVRVHDAAVPQNDTVTLTQDKIEPLIGRDGIYTLEILTVTPFNNGEPERLAYITMDIKRKVEIRGQMISSEN